MRQAIPLADRFWAKVNTSGDCWLWTGALFPTGYGKIGAGGKRGRTLYAHRVSYELSRGPIPSGYEVDHLCKVTACVRPDHLEAVPPTVNNSRSDSASALNHRKTHCKWGHPFTPENTARRGSWRVCRECDRRRCQEYYARRRQA